jgi:uncharacterized protein with NRDE domain
LIQECFELLADKNNPVVTSNEESSTSSNEGPNLLFSIFVPPIWFSPHSHSLGGGGGGGGSGLYGTRTSTVILIRKDTSGVLIEKNFDPSSDDHRQTQANPLLSTHQFGPFFI